MKKINLIVHIPKTAGTSFRYALQENESVHMLCDYGEEKPESSPELSGTDPMMLTPESEIFDAGKFNFICGHIDYDRYAHCIPPDSVVSIVRNPIERLISEYQHIKRLEGYALSFADFFSTPCQQNKQWNMLKGVDQESGALVGLTSHYKYFAEIFSNRLGLPVKPMAVNQAPDSDMEGRIDIPASEIKAAYLCNKQDMDFFFETAGVFSGLVRDAGYNTLPAGDTNWNCLMVRRQRVAGWLSCTATDCYFVEIDVNGERRAVISLDQNRGDIYGLELSENPLCGFSYPLALLGAEAGDKVTVGVLGAPEFTKTFNMDWE